MIDTFEVLVKIGAVSNHEKILGSLIGMLGVADSKVAALTKSMGGLRNVAAIVGGAFVADAAIKGFSTLITHGNTLLHQQALMQQAGLSQKEIAEATGQAWKTTSEALGSNVADNLASVRELRAVFGDLGEAMANVSMLTKAGVILTNLRGGDAEHGREEVFNIAKALEIHGVSMDPKHFAALADAWVKAEQAFGGKISGADLLSAMKFGRGAALGWDDQFIGTILPTLAQEMKSSGGGSGGGGAGGPGNALMSAYAAIVGGTMSNKAAEEFDHLKLIAPGAVIRTTTGAIKGIRPGGIQGSAEFASNPYAWTQDVLLPALKSMGITDPVAQREEVAHLFSNRTAQQIIGLFLTQQQRFQKDASLITGTPGIDATTKMMHDNDPKQVMRDFNAEWTNLLTALGGPLAQAALPIMRDLTSGLKYLDEVVIAHPAIATDLTELGVAIGVAGSITAVTGMIRFGAAIRTLATDAAAASTGLNAVGATPGLSTLGGKLGSVANGLGLLGIAVVGIKAVLDGAEWLDKKFPSPGQEGSPWKDWSDVPGTRHWWGKELPGVGTWLKDHLGFGGPGSGPGPDMSHPMTNAPIGSTLTHKESYLTGKAPTYVQVTTYAQLDGRTIAKVVSEHQARYGELPQGGTSRVDIGYSSPSSGQAFTV